MLGSPSTGSTTSPVLIGTLLLLHAALGTAFRLFAYPIGLKQSYNEQSGGNTLEWSPIREEFYQVCFPGLPAHPWKPRAPRFAYLRTNELLLAEGAKGCPENFRGEFSYSQEEVMHIIKTSSAKEFKALVFDPSLTVKRKRRESDGKIYYKVLSHPNVLTIDPESQNEDWRNSLEIKPFAISGIPKGPLTPGRVSVKVDMESGVGDDPDDRRSHPIWFNSDLRMGKAAIFNGPAANSVDWYIDRTWSPEYELVACKSNPSAPLLLKVIHGWEQLGDIAKVPKNCVKVQLTTSPNQLEHIKDLWNARQDAWTEHQINFMISPFYLYNYVVQERGIGEHPVFFRRDDPNKTPIPLDRFNSEPKKQTVNLDVARQAGVTKILDMSTDLWTHPDDFVSVREFEIDPDEYPLGWWDEDEDTETLPSGDDGEGDDRDDNDPGDGNREGRSDSSYDEFEDESSGDESDDPDDMEPELKKKVKYTPQNNH